MNCSKARMLIPDLLNRRISPEQKVGLESHLTECDLCSEWVEIWEDIRSAGLKTMTLPERIDWAPLSDSINLALQKQSRPGYHPKNIKGYWDYLQNGLGMLPRRFFFRLALSGSAAVLLILVGSYITLHSSPPNTLAQDKQKNAPYPYAFTAGAESGSGRIYYQSNNNLPIYTEAYLHQIRYQDQHGNVIYDMPETSCTLCHNAAHVFHDTSSAVREFD
jgi:hypothetical protein